MVVKVPSIVETTVQDSGLKRPDSTVIPLTVITVPPIVVTYESGGGWTIVVGFPPIMVTIVSGGGCVTMVCVVPSTTVSKVLAGGVESIVCNVPPTFVTIV